MMFINNYCTDFMFQEVMVCVTCSPSILSLMIGWVWHYGSCADSHDYEKRTVCLIKDCII